MKKRVIFSLFILLFISIQFLSFAPRRTHSDPAGLVTGQYHRDLEAFREAVNGLYFAASQLDEEKAPAYMLQDAHLYCRKTFKKIEFLIEYFDPTVVKNYLNGAPLPKLEPGVAEVNVLEPKGLQVLDELIFSEDPYVVKNEIIGLSRSLKKEYERIQVYQQNTGISHRHIFEAARKELIRIFTLGLTGFDTPGSVNAIPEAVEAMKSLAFAMEAYSPLLTEKDKRLQRELEKTFAEAVEYLEANGDFDSFNRMSFLKTFVNPLYSLVYQAQRQLGVERIGEVSDRIQPFHYDAQNIFDEDFLNPYFYANLHPKDVNPERIELGRLLFFDPILSANNERSCASCHDPQLAFTDGLAKSQAMNMEGSIERNAPTLVNSVYADRYFLDLRIELLEQQIAHVVLNEKEFNTDFQKIVDKLGQSSEYVQLFESAYADQKQYALSPWSVSNAISCYLLTLRGFNSPFDQYVRNEREELGEAAIRGFNLFMGKAGCATCHFAPAFSGLVPPEFMETESEVLGVPASNDPGTLSLDPDKGRSGSKRLKDLSEIYDHSFKTTTVRNIALTAPYMHNGVYATLEEVVDFYNKGGGAGMGIEVPNQTLPDAPLNLTKQEQKDIITFMQTLTDTTGMTAIPAHLPLFDQKPEWNKRSVGGNY